jgi:hypothetical protein
MRLAAAAAMMAILTTSNVRPRCFILEQYANPQWVTFWRGEPASLSGERAAIREGKAWREVRYTEIDDFPICNGIEVTPDEMRLPTRLPISKP